MFMLIIGYIVGFFMMTIVASFSLLLGLSVIIAIVSFAAWSPIFLTLDLLLGVRICISIGIILGIWFTLSKEGKECAVDFAEKGFK
jgi:ABC-type proline/glycine betaine transport system permease subunit